MPIRPNTAITVITTIPTVVVAQGFFGFGASVVNLFGASLVNVFGDLEANVLGKVVTISLQVIS